MSASSPKLAAGNRKSETGCGRFSRKKIQQADFMNDDLRNRAKAIVATSLVCDMMLPWEASYASEELLERFKVSGFSALSLTVAGDGGGPEQAIAYMQAVRERLSAKPETYRLVSVASDLERGEPLAIVFNGQGTNCVGRDIDNVEKLYRLGMRHMLLAYQLRNAVADGCAERTDGGLSKFGLRLIAEMNRVGMIVDGTHSGYRSTMEAMEASLNPCMFSHSNSNTVFPHYRNLKDDQIKACARGGGLIGVNGLAEFLHLEPASPAAMVKHIAYIADLVGPEHVGIGLDYVADTAGLARWIAANPDAWPPANGRPYGETTFLQPEQLVDMVVLLVGRGFSDLEVSGILGGNFRRLAHRVWKQPN